MCIILTKDTPATHIKVKGQECTHRLSHSDTPICQNLVCFYQKAKTILPDSNSWWKYNSHIEVKGQGHTEVMNACDTIRTCTMVIHSHAKHSFTNMSKDKKAVAQTQKACLDSQWFRYTPELHSRVCVL